MSWKYVQRDENGKYRTTDQGGGGGGGASALTELDDVSVSSPSDGQILTYDDATDKWVNRNPSSGHTYSTTEQVVGTWIDGKPVYEKTIISNYTVHSTGTYSITIDIHELNIDTPISINGFWRRWAGDGNKLYYQFGSDEATYGIGWARIDSENGHTNGQLMIQIKSDGTDLQIITIRYIKTTD